MNLLTLAYHAKVALVDLVTPRPRDGETALAYLFRIDRLDDPGPHETKLGVDPINLDAVRRAGHWTLNRDRSSDSTFAGVVREGHFSSKEDGATPSDDGVKVYRSHADDFEVRTRPWRGTFRKHLLPHQRVELDELYARAYGARGGASTTLT